MNTRHVFSNYKANSSRACYIPARYVLVAAKVVNSFAGALMDGSMSLAITAMAGKKSSSPTTSNSTALTDVCTANTEQSTTATQQDQQEGEFDWDELTQSFVTNANTYGALFTILIGARLVELWSPKKLLVYSSFVYTPLHMLVPLFARWNVYALIASRILYGIFLAPSSPGVVALMAAWFPPDERQLLNSIISCVSSLGSIVSTSLSGYLITQYGWAFVFYLYGGLHIASNLLYVFFIYDTPQEHPRISEEERNYLVTAINKQPKMSLAVPWGHIITSKPLWAHISVIVGITWTKFIFSTELPTYLKRMLHYNTLTTGYITSAIHATSWFSELFFGVLSRWLRKKRYFSLLTTYKIFNAIAMLGPVATLVAVTQANYDGRLIVTLLVLHFFVSSAYMAGSVVNYLDLAINFAPTLSAFASTLGNAVAVASPAVAGYLTNNQQTLTAWSKIFYISAVVSALPYAIFFVFGSTEEQPWNRPEQQQGSDKNAPEADVDMPAASPCAKRRRSSAVLSSP